MALADINVPATVHKSKWGLFGKILGGIAGAVAGLATGGTASGPLAAAGAALGGAAGGMGLGGTVGEAIDPSKMEAGQGVPRVESAMPETPAPATQKEGTLSRYAMNDPDVQIKLIKDSMDDVLKHPRLSPEAKDEYVQFGSTAIDRIRKPVDQRLTLGRTL